MDEPGLKDEPPQPTYSVISYPASKLPDRFKALIFSKWLRSLRFGNPLFEHADSASYYREYHLYIEKLLAKPDSIVRLAVLTDDQDVVLGFSVSREDVLDYVHVHKDHRNMYIGSKLVPDFITTFTHLTKSAVAIWHEKPKFRHLKFNPFA